jgi:hypothetical protein
LAHAGPRDLDEWFPHLREGMWVRVEGEMQAAALHASEIKILDGDLDESELSSQVTEVDLLQMTLTTRLGVRVVATQSSDIDQKKSGRDVGFAYIEVDDQVEVEGQLQKDGTLLAEEMEVTRPSQAASDSTEMREHEMTARIEAVDPKQYRITLLGVSVVLSEKTKNRTPFFD